jgi:hypothetical protein
MATARVIPANNVIDPMIHYTTSKHRLPQRVDPLMGVTALRKITILSAGARCLMTLQETVRTRVM